MAELQNYKCKEPAYCFSPSSEIAGGGQPAPLLLFMLSWLSDFVVCSTSHYIWSSGVYI